VAKALALGADAVSIGVAALIALGDNSPELEDGYADLGSSAGFYDDWHEGRDPAGISTQDDDLAARFDPELGGRRLANYLRTMTLEAQTLARACGKSHLHNLEPEDVVALTVEAAAMARVPLAGTDYIPGVSESNALEEIKTMLDRYLENPIDALPAAQRVHD
jgi:methylamine---glutamate N-methyltransferase subunit C